MALNIYQTDTPTNKTMVKVGAVTPNTTAPAKQLTPVTTTSTVKSGGYADPLTSSSDYNNFIKGLSQTASTITGKEEPSTLQPIANKVNQQAQALVQSKNPSYTYPTEATAGTSGGTSGGGSVGGGAVASTPNYGDIFSQIKSLIDKEKADRDALAEENYKKLVMDANNSFESNRNAITKNNALTQRWLKQTYGGGLSGAGLTNQLRAQTNYQNNLYGARQNLASMMQNAQIQKGTDLLNSQSTYNGNYNNYIVNPLMDLANKNVDIAELLKKLK